MAGDLIGRLHALLRLLLPRRFREVHAEEMERVLRERLQAARRHGAWGRARVWVWEAWDLAVTGARLRTSERTHGKPRGGATGGWIDDLVSALRSLRRSPGFAAFAVGTLALGVGATIAFASFFDRVVLRPVDFPRADRMVMVWRWRESGAMAHLMISPDLHTRDRVRRADAFAGVTATGGETVAWSTEDGPRMLSAVLMDEALPALAGMPPLLGRYFSREDLAGSGAAVALLSEGLWKRAFGSDSDVLGRTMRIEGELRTIVGVAPEALRLPAPGSSDVDVWLPLPADGWKLGANVFARLKDGVTLERAHEEMKALDLAASEAERNGWGTRLVPVAEMAVGSLKNPLKVAGAAVALLLLIACLNVGNLLLARGDALTRDTAVRAALGAGRLRLGRELFFESLALSAVASVLGVGLASAAIRLIRAVRPEQWALLASLHLDPAVTAAAVVVAVGTVLLFGTLPLAHRVRVAPAEALTERAGTAGMRALALRRGLLVGEVALSFALLAGGVQVVSTLGKVAGRDPGLAVHELMSVRFDLPSWHFPDAASKEATLAELVRRARRIPGVESVTLASGTPPHTGIFFGAAEAEGEPVPEDAEDRVVFFGNSVAPGYFGTVSQALLEGRAFTDDDANADPAPYILGESAAKKYFPGGHAVGGHFRLSKDEDWHEVIGVVRDIWATGSADDAGYPQLYVMLDRGEGSSLLVRGADPESLAAGLGTLIRAVDKEITVIEMSPVARLYYKALARERLVALLLAAFAVTAVLLAGVGLYGVVAQVAVRRIREFGIRISLGAERASIFALAMRGGAVVVSAGLLLGSALAWAGLRFLETGVVGLERPSPPAFAGAAVLLAAVTLAAMGLPAVRASRTNAIDALREE